MNYQTLSPSDCAAEVLDEILKCVGDDPAMKDRIARLVRQKARTILEQCAMIAEDYTSDHDLNGELTGCQIGDAIAECIRQIADERRGERELAALRITAD
jgi:hypothetical protein